MTVPFLARLTGEVAAWLAGPWLGNAASDRDWRTPYRGYFFASESLHSPTSETTPDVIRIDFQRVAHLPERERSTLLVMKKPGFRKLLLLRRAASVEIDLIASHCIDQNCVHKTREWLELSADLPLVKELRGQNRVGSK